MKKKCSFSEVAVGHVDASFIVFRSSNGHSRHIRNDYKKKQSVSPESVSNRRRHSKLYWKDVCCATGIGVVVPVTMCFISFTFSRRLISPWFIWVRRSVYFFYYGNELIVKPALRRLRPTFSWLITSPVIGAYFVNFMPRYPMCAGGWLEPIGTDDY